MRQGMFPGQQQLLIEYARKGIEAESGLRRTRRRFLATLSVAVPVALGGGIFAGHFWGRRAADDRRNPTDDVVFARIEWARRLAQGSEAALLASNATFLMVLDRCGGDDVLWGGFSRLAAAALASDAPERRALADRLLVSCRAQALPPSLRDLPDRLRAHVRERR